MTTKFIAPPYDPLVDYFDMACKYEKLSEGDTYNVETMLQINSRLADNTRIRMADGTVNISAGLKLKNEEINEFWYKWTIRLLRTRNQRKKMDTKDMDRLVAKLNSPDASQDIMYAFITLNFDDEKISMAPDKFLKWLPRISYKVANKNYEENKIRTCEYIFEKHRVNGIHHHAHFLFTFHEKIAPSKMINKIWEIAEIKDFIVDKNFVDYKGPQKAPCAPYEYYYGYIRGDKREEKLPCVALDVAWRNNNKLIHLNSK